MKFYVKMYDNSLFNKGDKLPPIDIKFAKNVLSVLCLFELHLSLKDTIRDFFQTMLSYEYLNNLTDSSTV